MSTYRTRPQLIEAVQCDKDNFDKVAAHLGMEIHKRYPGYLILFNRLRGSGSLEIADFTLLFKRGKVVDAFLTDEPEPAGGEG